MPIHQEIEWSNQIQEDLFDIECDNEAVEDNDMAPRNLYGMIANSYFMDQSAL